MKLTSQSDDFINKVDLLTQTQYIASENDCEEYPLLKGGRHESSNISRDFF